MSIADAFILILFVLSSALCIYVDYKLRSPAIVLSISLALFFALPHAYDAIAGTTEFAEFAYSDASVFAGLFNFSYLTVRLYRLFRMLHSGNPESYLIPTGQNTWFTRFLSVSLWSSVLLWIVGMYTVNPDLLHSTWTNMLNVPSLFSTPANYLSFIGTGCLILSFIERRWRIFLPAVAACLILILFVRSRSLLIPLSLPFFIYSLFLHRGLKARTLQIAGGALLIFAVFFLQQLRWVGSLTSVPDAISQISSNTVARLEQGKGEFSQRKLFYRFIQDENNFQNFATAGTYRRLLLLPFPSFLLPDQLKPQDFAIDMHYAVHWSYGTPGTEHPILYGDAFANFGWPGWTMGFIWGLIASVIDALLLAINARIALGLLASVTSMYTLASRGSIYNPTAAVLWSGIALAAMHQFSLSGIPWLRTKIGTHL